MYKAGFVCDPVSGDLIGPTDDKEEITASIDGSLQRLKTDHLDLVKFHLNRHPIAESEGVFEAFSDAYKAGKIDGFGWSNDNLEGALAFADLDGYVAVQHDLNLFLPRMTCCTGLKRMAYGRSTGNRSRWDCCLENIRRTAPRPKPTMSGQAVWNDYVISAQMVRQQRSLSTQLKKYAACSRRMAALLHRGLWVGALPNLSVQFPCQVVARPSKRSIILVCCPFQQWQPKLSMRLAS